MGLLGGAVDRMVRTNSPIARPSSASRPGTVAVPERHLAGLAGRGGDHDPFEGDVLDAPGRGTEQEGLAHPGLVDHLLVELADPCAVGQEDAVQAAVGDGAARGHRQALRTGAAPHGAREAVPHDPGAQLGELLGRVPPGEQVEGVLEQPRATAPSSCRHCGTGRTARRPATRRGHRRRRSAAPARRGGWRGTLVCSMQPVAHALHDDGRLEQVGAVLGEDAAAAGCAHLVTGAADALQARGHRTGRLDLHDQVDRAHVDAQLERAGRHQAPEVAALELVLDQEPAFARQRPVVGLDQLLPLRRARCRPPRRRRGGVDVAVSRCSSASSLSRLASRSARRRALTNTSVERCDSTSASSSGCIDGQMDARLRPPHVGRRVRVRSTRWRRRVAGRPTQARPMSSTGTTTEMSSSLRMPASTMVTGRARADVGPVGVAPPRKSATTSSGRCVADSPMRWNVGPDSSLGTTAGGLESLHRQGQVCTPLGRGEGVDLVDDDAAGPRAACSRAWR